MQQEAIKRASHLKTAKYHQADWRVAAKEEKTRKERKNVTEEIIKKERQKREERKRRKGKNEEKRNAIKKDKRTALEGELKFDVTEEA